MGTTFAIFRLSGKQPVCNDLSLDGVKLWNYLGLDGVKLWNDLSLEGVKIWND